MNKYNSGFLRIPLYIYVNKYRENILNLLSHIKSSKIYSEMKQ